MLNCLIRQYAPETEITRAGDAKLICRILAGMIFYQGFPRWVIVLTGVEASAGIELMNSECIGRKKQEYSWYGLLPSSA